MITQLEAPELSGALASGRVIALLDVREPWEVATASFPGATNVPMQSVPQSIEAIRALQNEGELAIICHHGSRSMHVAQFLANQGFDQLINLRGGIDAWSRAVDASVPRY